MRRIIIHAGFHKTGTTNLQQTLRANRAALRPEIRLVLRPGMKALCEAARAYSLTREEYDLGLVKYEAALLVESLQTEQATTAIISSEDLSGHMPGRHGLHGYGATPHIMRAIWVAFKTAAPDTALSFFFTTRTQDAWLRSCYAQHLRAYRMTWDEADYLKRLRASADHIRIVDLIKRELPEVPMYHAALEDHCDRPLGIAEALLDALDISANRRDGFVRSDTRNAALSPALLDELLTLNRSDLDAPSLRAAKRALIDEVQ